MVCEKRGVWLEVQYLTPTTKKRKKKKRSTSCLVAECCCMWICWQAKCLFGPPLLRTEHSPDHILMLGPGPQSAARYQQKTNYKSVCVCVCVWGGGGGAR